MKFGKAKVWTITIIIKILWDLDRLQRTVDYCEGEEGYVYYQNQ
jgi:hypothetical protein